MDMLGGMAGEREASPICGSRSICKRNDERLAELIDGYVVEIETNPRVMFGNDPASEPREFEVPDYIAFPVVRDFLAKHEGELLEIMAEKMTEARRRGE